MVPSCSGRLGKHLTAFAHGNALVVLALLMSTRSFGMWDHQGSNFTLLLLAFLVATPLESSGDARANMAQPSLEARLVAVLPMCMQARAARLMHRGGAWVSEKSASATMTVILSRRSLVVSSCGLGRTNSR